MKVRSIVEMEDQMEVANKEVEVYRHKCVPPPTHTHTYLVRLLVDACLPAASHTCARSPARPVLMLTTAACFRTWIPRVEGGGGGGGGGSCLWCTHTDLLGHCVS